MRPVPRILLAAVILTGAVAVGWIIWWEYSHPLAQLGADRVTLARIVPLPAGRGAGRDLTAEEIAELCRLLAGARTAGAVDAAGSLRIELDTLDFARVEIVDIAGPGCRAALFAGVPGEKRYTLRSPELGGFLARLGGSPAADDRRRRP